MAFNTQLQELSSGRKLWIQGLGFRDLGFRDLGFSVWGLGFAIIRFSGMLYSTYTKIESFLLYILYIYIHCGILVKIP